MTNRDLADEGPEAVPIRHPAELPDGGIAVVGLPFDGNSSFLRGPAAGPASLRRVLHAGSSNLTTEEGTDLGTSEAWGHIGDLELDEDGADQAIEQGIASLLDRGLRFVALGGDHSVTFPILRALGPRHRDLTIVHLDAHPDLYDELDGNRLSHACPFARILEAGLAQRLIQIGIRTLNEPQRRQAERFGVEILPAKEWTCDRLPEVSGDVYLSLDLDVLDPAYAPGVSHHEPGGLSSRQVLTILQNLGGNLVGADIVELNPHRDPLDMTAMVAAKCLKEVLGRML
ncbi:MAG: agmatinase [Acidobacteriota bacterium]